MISDYLDKKPDIKEAAFIAKTANLIGNVILHKDTSVWFNVVLRGDIQKIEVEEGSNIQDGTVVHVDHETPVLIGKNVTVGHNVTLHACTIEDNCLIGMGSVILDNAVIGKGSLVAAGSVVPPGMKVPSGSLVIGVPAKIKKQLTIQEKQKIIENGLAYIDLASHYNRGEK